MAIFPQSLVPRPLLSTFYSVSMRPHPSPCLRCSKLNLSFYHPNALVPVNMISLTHCSSQKLSTSPGFHPFSSHLTFDPLGPIDSITSIYLSPSNNLHPHLPPHYQNSLLSSLFTSIYLQIIFYIWGRWPLEIWITLNKFSILKIAMDFLCTPKNSP